MKVLIMVQSVQKSRYPELIMLQKETWDSIEHPHVSTLFYYPNPVSEGITGKDVLIKGEDNWGYMFIQTMKAFRNVMNIEWDYIFKTDNSTYVDKKRLYEILFTKPRENFYGGTLGRIIDKSSNEETPFLWGEGMAMSRDIVKYLVDCYIANPFMRLGVEDIHIGRVLNEKCNWDTSMQVIDFYANKEQLVKDAHIYRCRNANGEVFTDDIKAMKWIHSKISES